MSKKNIVSQKEVDGGKTHVTFEVSDGSHMTYEFSKRQSGYLKRGSDPANLSGKLVKEKK
jgi:hypothetical protein